MFEDLKAKQMKSKGFSEGAAVAKVMKAPKDSGLVDMKRTKADKKKSEANMKSSPYSGEDYPYGLRLDLNQDAMEKLGMELPTVGSTVTVTAKARIERAEMSDSGDGKRKSCCLQITKLKVT